MPCNCEYLNPTNLEQELSKVACLLDELRGRPWNPDNWKGYHPKVYGKATKELGDSLVAKLCSELQGLNVTTYSLEMQIWWRDHQRADKKRLKKEMENLKDEEAKNLALAKLTSYEKRLLGLIK